MFYKILHIYPVLNETKKEETIRPENFVWVCICNRKEMTSIVYQYNKLQKQLNGVFSNSKLITADILVEFYKLELVKKYNFQNK